MNNENKILSAAAYAFFVPALYIILSDKRKVAFNADHSSKALLLWVIYGVIYLVLRTIYGISTHFYYTPVFDWLLMSLHLAMWIYAIWLGLMAFQNKTVEIPYVSDLARKLK